MPISGASSYLPTTEEFEQHWSTADATLGVGSEIVLPDGTGLAALTAKKVKLADKHTEIQGKLNEKETARGDLDIQKRDLLAWLLAFNRKVRAFFPDSKWLRGLPDVPGSSEGQSKITDALDDANSMWQLINADPATASPVVLIDGYDQAAFDAGIITLKATFTIWNAAKTTLTVTREERNVLQGDIYAVLKSYRQVLPTMFAEDHALVQSLPRLTPLPGSTPDAVVASVEWDDLTAQAKITWTPSSDSNLQDYEVRYVAGPDYSTDDEATAGTVQPGETLELFTAYGLNGPGTTASYKVYVRLNTGNEKGSNAVSITQQ